VELVTDLLSLFSRLFLSGYFLLDALIYYASKCVDLQDLQNKEKLGALYTAFLC